MSFTFRFSITAGHPFCGKETDAALEGAKKNIFTKAHVTITGGLSEAKHLNQMHT